MADLDWSRYGITPDRDGEVWLSHLDCAWESTVSGPADRPYPDRLSDYLDAARRHEAAGCTPAEPAEPGPRKAQAWVEEVPAAGGTVTHRLGGDVLVIAYSVVETATVDNAVSLSRTGPDTVVVGPSEHGVRVVVLRQ